MGFEISFDPGVVIAMVVIHGGDPHMDAMKTCICFMAWTSLFEMYVSDWRMTLNRRQWILSKGGINVTGSDTTDKLDNNTSLY
jgi:hypothetical protein